MLSINDPFSLEKIRNDEYEKMINDIRKMDYAKKILRELGVQTDALSLLDLLRNEKRLQEISSKLKLMVFW